LDPAFYPHHPETVELVQTHISWVFLAGDYVYKVKRPVDLGFLDFRTLHRRRHLCEEEVRLNRRLAADTYLDVVEVKRGDGGFRLGGPGRTEEVAVWMRRLPADRMLDRLVAEGRADHLLMEDIGRVVADFHVAAARSRAIDHCGRRDVIRRNWAENFAQTRRFPAEVLAPATRRKVEGFVRRFLAREGARLAARVRAGRIRDCHGDLQAQHVCVTEPIRIFDCIEFNHRFRYGDTAAEIAFLAMDLEAAGRADLAMGFVGAYLDASGDYGAVPLLDFYRAYRAWVRGKVYGLMAQDPAREDRQAMSARARNYFEQATSYATPHPAPRLTVMTGLAGSGKTTLARTRAGRDTIVVRTDAVRKQLAGVHWSQRGGALVGEGLYSAEMTERTYAECLRVADELLRAGWSVILDGVFGRRAEREAFRARASAARDLSDASEDILDAQRASYEPPDGEPDVERQPAG
jgi:hypothetical protein